MAPVVPSEAHPVHTHRVIGVVVAGTLLLGLLAIFLSTRAAHRVNRTSLAASPQPVTVTAARPETYRDSRTYVGAVDSWVEANIGPQYISAYVLDVPVRPGAVVRKGDVLATLDCTDPSAASRAVAMRTKAIGARMRANTAEATRVASLLDGGFVALNDVEQKNALAASEQAQVQASQADLAKSSAYVQDCVLRAPFDAEVATRTFDPGAFVRPGASIVSVVDRNSVRVVVDAPEKDFDALAPGAVVDIDLLATGATLTAPISRRAPKANPGTRTIRFEVALPDPKRQYPVGTSAIVHVAVGPPTPATAIPLYAATQESGKAKLFSVVGDTAHSLTLPVLGESAGELFFAPNVLGPNTLVVTEGRALLTDGAKVQAKVELSTPEPGDGGASTRGGGYGRPI